MKKRLLASLLAFSLCLTSALCYAEPEPQQIEDQIEATTTEDDTTDVTDTDITPAEPSEQPDSETIGDADIAPDEEIAEEVTEEATDEITDETTVDPANATVIGLNVQKHTQAEIQAFFNSHPALISDPVLFDIAPSKEAPYSEGKLSSLTTERAMNMLNQVRYIAGLNADVEYDATLESYTQAGTYLNYLNKDLSHHPSRPGVLADSSYDDLYTRGLRGSGSSNIAWGYGTLTSAIISGWMDDGDAYNIAAVGHRRWLLNPYMKYSAFGYSYSYSAVYAHNESGSGNQSYVAWPAQTMPVNYFNASMPWSLSVGKRVNIDTTSVTLTRKRDGQTWNFSAASSDGAFYVENNYYGQQGCIIFRPTGLGSISATDSFDVSISLDSGATLVNYTVDFFTLDTSTAPQYINSASVTMSQNVKGYGGTSTTAEVVVDFNGTTLTKDVDYTIAYKRNSAGRVTEMTLTGIGRFTGSKTVKFINVEYELNGGTEEQHNAAVVIVNDTMNLNDPVRSGYIFMGWYDNAAFEGDKITQIGNGGQESITLYAKWLQKIQYSITYNVNGGAYGPSNISQFGYPIVSTMIPVRFGYNFLGWGTSATAKTATYLPGETLPAQSSFDLYAVWKEPELISTETNLSTYYATFLNAYQLIYYKIVPDATRMYEIQTTDAHDSIGYLYDENQKQIAYNDDDGPGWNFLFSAQLEAGKTYYLGVKQYGTTNFEPVFTLQVRRSAKVSYNANGGNAAPADQFATEIGDPLTVSSDVPTKSFTIKFNANGGTCKTTSSKKTATFIGWNTKADGTGTNYETGSCYDGEEDLILYAAWDTVTYGTLPTPTRDGYKFNGWYTSETGGSKVTSKSEVTKSRTLYAHWSEIVTKITKQPETVTAGVNASISFTVEATGYNLTYQWQYSKDGKKWYNSSTSTAKTNSIAIKVSSSNKGNIYRCVITDGHGKTVTTDTAGIDLIPGVVIVEKPQSVAALLKTTVYFNVVAENAASYRWQYSKDGSNWYNSSATGSNTDTLTVKVSTTNQGNRYRCVILGIDGNQKISSAATLIVLKETPQNSTAAIGSKATFTVKADGIESYQWQYSKDGGASWYNSSVTGAQTDTISIKASSTNRSMLYRCKLTTPEGASAATSPVGFLA